MKNFKKFSAVILAAAMLTTALCGCAETKGDNGDGATGAPATDAPFVQTTLPPGGISDALKYDFKESDLMPIYFGRSIVLGSSETILEKVIGTPDAINEAESCMFDGKDKTYIYNETCEVFTFPAEDGSGNIIDEIYFSGSEVPLVCRGVITIGDTKDEIVDVYGENFYMDGDTTMVYNVENDPEKNQTLPKLYFDLEDDVVVGIGFCANLYHSEA